MRTPARLSMSLLLLLVSWTGAFAAEPSAEQRGPREDPEVMVIQLRQDRLTVRLREAPLDAVLAEVGRRAAIDISILGPLTDGVSMEFRDLPLDEGLRRLLRGHGSLRQYGGDTLRKVVVVPFGSGAGRGTAEWEADAIRVRALAALLAREGVKTFLGAYLHAPTARVRRDAFRGLLGAVTVEEIELLIELVEDDRAGPKDWGAVLGALSGVLTPQQRWLIIRSLSDRSGREQLARVLGSYLTYKTRGEKTPR